VSDRFLRVCLCLSAALAAYGQTVERRAAITGGGRADSGKCTIEVVVDGSADIEIRGDRAWLRTVTGQPAEWRRFQCSAVLPAYPEEFRFRGIDGRGNQELAQDPRNGRGTVVVRIQDPRGGAEGYTFDIEWRGAGSPQMPPGPADDEPGRAYGRGGGWASADAVAACLSAIEQRGRRDGYRALRFGSIRVDDRPGRADWIVGSVRAQRDPGRPVELEFACRGDLETGRIRSAQLNPR
jgi:hypothetical protein